MTLTIFLEQSFDPNAGGVQRSTSKLAIIFKDKGYKVLIISSFTGEEKLEVWNDIPIFYINIRVDYLVFRELVKIHSISLIINQAGYSYSITRFLSLNLSMNTKVINTLRINPLNFYDNYKFMIDSFFERKGLSFFKIRFVYKLILLYHIYKQRYELNYIIKNTDAFVMLSERFMPELYFLAPQLRNYDSKIFGISNPFVRPNITIGSLEKEKIVLFVGRLNILQKRVDLLLQIWMRLHADCLDWKFWICGEGEDEKYMRDFCLENRLERVIFFGKVNPNEYYKKAKLFHMTSAFEGFGNVLIEAQSYGCVPILFDSYAAASDIVIHDKNGILIPPFDIEDYVNKTKVLMDNPQFLTDLAENGFDNVLRFSYEETYEKWQVVFDSSKLVD